MRVTQYARQSLAAAVLALGLAACSKDNSGPSEFNPEGTSADMAAAQGAFASEQTSSFAALSSDISVVLGGSPVVVASAALASPRPSAASARYARQLASMVPAAGRRIQASSAAVPSEVLGTTFVWDAASEAYVASEEAGAPSSGVRFVLYAVDPVQLRPVEPLVEVGYVDVIDQSSETTTDVRVKIVEGNVVYLDYDVVGTATASGAIISVSGFASNGSTIANFTLKNTVSQNASGLVLSLDYDLTVPSRDVSVNWTATFANISESEVVVTLDLSVSGTNGSVRLLGTFGASGGSFTVKVNGDSFATVTLNGSVAEITGAGGEPLTTDEEQALQAILDYFDASLSVFTELMLPIA